MNVVNAPQTSSDAPSPDANVFADSAEADADALEGAIIHMMRFLTRGAPETPLMELPGAQVRGLMIVRRHEGLKMQELAAKMDTTLPATSQIVDRLVKRGLVERRDDPADRRVVRLHLQEEARAVTGVLHAARRTRLTQAIALLKSENNFVKTLEGVHLLADAARRTSETAGKMEASANFAAAVSDNAGANLPPDEPWRMPNAVLEENSEETKR